MSPRKELLNKKVVEGYVKEILKYYAGRNGEKPRLVLVVGGGNISRIYRDFADSCGESSDVDRHRIGITATWLNAELIRSLLDEVAYKRVLGVGVYAENRKIAEKMMAKDFEQWLGSDTPVLVAGGFINGASTDFNAVLLASKIGVDMYHKFSDVDYIYSGDPRDDKSAKPIKDMSWDEYFRLFDLSLDQAEHKPGQHVPVDMLAAKLASENKISCTFMDGREPTVITKVLDGRELKSTLVHP